MHRKTLLAWTAVCALTFTACSGSPETLLSPSGAAPTSADLNADGSTLKVSAPTDLRPNGDEVLNSVRPTLTFTPAVARFGTANFDHELEIVNANEQVVYHSAAASSPHRVSADLTYSDNFWWRARARLGEQFGPWSEWAPFRTPEPSAGVPTPVSSGGLPFAIPAACGPGGPSDRSACAIAMTQASPWWQDCRRGSGVGCHRYTRSLAAALAASDPGWGLLTKNPGQQQCTWNACGGGVRGGFGEDVVTHWDGRTLRAWDVVTGAGAPGANAGWSRISSFRAGNVWAPVPPLGTR